MSKHETRKISKISAELMNYLLLRGYTSFTFGLKRDQAQTTITLELPNVGKKDVKEIIEKVGKEKNREVEMYGWELIGEGGYKDQLEVLGMLVDRVEVEEMESSIRLIFIRNRFLG